MHVLFYATLLLGCFAYAMAWGGWPERAGASILLAGTALTFLAASPLQERFSSVETGIFVVDVIVLLAYLTLALNTERFWPLWITAFQLLGTLAHLAKWADPLMFRHGYGFILAVWSYLQLLVIVLGTRAQRRVNRKRAAARY